MWRYLREAFWARVRLPLLGGLPLNAVALGSLGILGFANPGFWLLALGFEAVYLYGMTLWPAFRRRVDALRHEGILALDRETESGAEEERQALVEALPRASRERLARLEADCEKVLETLERKRGAGLVLENQREGLRRLAWSYLKLLTAQEETAALAGEGAEEELRAQLAELVHELRADDLSATARKSKEETMDLLRRRLRHLERRETLLEEMESDLERIEAHVALALDNASLTGAETEIPTDIAMARFLLDEDLYGQTGAAVGRLEREYDRPMERYAAEGYGAVRPDAAPAGSESPSTDAASPAPSREGNGSSS